jgi:transposase
MSKVKELNFEGQTIFCALDVHKKSWRTNIRDTDFELENYSQDPDPQALVAHLKKKYPGANYQVAYEAGFCGFGIQRFLQQAGIDCIIVNPADVPSSDRDIRRKTDTVDARKISRELSKGGLKGIYVPSEEMEHARSLVRQRTRLVRDQTRCKNRIWHLLMFSGLQLQPDDGPMKHWGRRFVDSLRRLGCPSAPLRLTLDIALEEYLQVRKLLSTATRHIRALSRQPAFEGTQKLLQTIPGIGLVNAMVIMTEVQDMARFKTLDKLCSFAGIVPDTDSSGESEKSRGITHRNNDYLRPAVVESSWMLIRKDPAMLMKYRKYCSAMNPNKAIIKIAKHLLSRIRYVWANKVGYEKAVVA